MYVYIYIIIEKIKKKLIRNIHVELDCDTNFLLLYKKMRSPCYHETTLDDIYQPLAWSLQLNLAIFCAP